MSLYAGIDLHSNNSYVAVIDDADQVVASQRLPNELAVVLRFLEPHRNDLEGAVVEATYNWYWLVDGLEESGYVVHLANPLAAKQYEGLKHTDDKTDAIWLARMLRLGILPTGWICPKEHRAVRDLLRKRTQLVRQRTSGWLGIRNILERTAAKKLKSGGLRRLTIEEISEGIEDPNVLLSLRATFAVVEVIKAQIGVLEDAVFEQAAHEDTYEILTSIPGVGPILASTIQYETGDISRFPNAGNYASYCRLVQSQRRSNQRVKGKGLRKNGNAYLSWAFHEAAHFAVRFQPSARRWYDRKQSKTSRIIAIRAVAHKLARAVYFMMRDRVPYEPSLVFG